MPPATPELITTASHLLQYGFAGFSLILLAIIVWLVKELIAVLRENNKILADHNQVMGAIGDKLRSVEGLQIELKDELNRRPCISDRNVR